MTRRTRTVLLVGLGVAVLVAVLGSRLASSQPDGLERVAADHGLDADAPDHALGDGPFADYSAPGVDDDGAGGGVAGVIGIVVVFAAATGLVSLATWGSARRRRPPPATAAAPGA